MVKLFSQFRNLLRLNRVVDKGMYIWKNISCVLFGRLRGTVLQPVSTSAVAICLRFRDEALYLKEWLDYHAAAGVSHFFLYDNNSTDNFREVLAPYLASGLVSLIAWPLSPASPSAEEDCIRRAVGRYKWVGFIDADEFIVVKDGRSIANFLAEYENYPGVALHWYFFGSNGHKARPIGSVLEAYTRRRATPDIHVKTFVQPTLVTQCNNSHSWFYKGAKSAVNEHGIRVWGSRSYPPSGDIAWINHYYTKSEEDYLAKMRQKTTLDLSGMRSPSRTAERMRHHLTDNNDVTCLRAIEYRNKNLRLLNAAQNTSKIIATPKVYVIILNWNGWRDTIECLESILRMEYPNFHVVVCDNASSDESLTHIKEWADGKRFAEPGNPEMARLTTPAIPKPISYRVVDPGCRASKSQASVRLTLIDTKQNLGFAGGCNVGLRFALAQGDCDYAWLLNNDTVVDPAALSELVRYVEKDPRLGITGSTIVDYYNTLVIQARGGTRYNKWMARTPAVKPQPVGGPEGLDCILGCSMLVGRAFLDHIGLMDEGYFLYFEELDWAARGKGRYGMGYAASSYVYHKEGASIGSSRNRAQRSLLSERYLSRNRILFTRRFHPLLLPSVMFWVGVSALQRAAVGDIKRARAILSAAREGLVT